MPLGFWLGLQHHPTRLALVAPVAPCHEGPADTKPLGFVGHAATRVSGLQHHSIGSISTLIQPPPPLPPPILLHSLLASQLAQTCDEEEEDINKQEACKAHIHY